MANCAIVGIVYISGLETAQSPLLTRVTLIFARLPFHVLRSPICFALVRGHRIGFFLSLAVSFFDDAFGCVARSENMKELELRFGNSVSAECACLQIYFLAFPQQSFQLGVRSM